jgi:hypothetical protein
MKLLVVPIALAAVVAVALLGRTTPPQARQVAAVASSSPAVVWVPVLTQPRVTGGDGIVGRAGFGVHDDVPVSRATRETRWIGPALRNGAVERR